MHVCVCRSNHEGFFTSDSTMKKEKFMSQLNFSYKLGGWDLGIGTISIL